MEETIWTLPPSTRTHQHCCTAWRRKQMTSSRPLKSLLRIKRNMPKWWRKWMTYTKFKHTLLLERVLFNRRSQQPGETIEQYITVLYQLITTCMQHRKRQDASRLHCHGNCRLETLRVPTTECGPYPREGNQRGHWQRKPIRRETKTAQQCKRCERKATQKGNDLPLQLPTLTQPLRVAVNFQTDMAMMPDTRSVLQPGKNGVNKTHQSLLIQPRSPHHLLKHHLTDSVLSWCNRWTCTGNLRPLHLEQWKKLNVNVVMRK